MLFRSEICRNAIRPTLSELREKFPENGKLSDWMDKLTEDVVENFGMFVAATRDENAETDFSRFTVNVFVSNDPEGGAPVVRETNPTYYNIMGKIEYESRQGYLYTDFHRIKPGALHKANGGYLLLEAENLLRQFMSWDALKRVLTSGELTIENLGEHLGFIPVASLRPEAIPINVKVVIANRMTAATEENSTTSGYPTAQPSSPPASSRSEERRVGKECRSRWSPYH